MVYWESDSATSISSGLRNSMQHFNSRLVTVLVSSDNQLIICLIVQYCAQTGDQQAQECCKVFFAVVLYRCPALDLHGLHQA